MQKKRNDELVKYVERMFGKDADFKENIADGHISRVCKVLGVDRDSIEAQMMNIIVKDEDIVEQNIKDYGTAKSGNWGHKGRPGKHGGSAKGTGSKAYRGQGKQYNTGQVSAQKYYGNRKEWANGLKGDKGRRADTLIADYAKRFDEALAKGNITLKKANTMKFDSPEEQKKYLSTLQDWQVKEYHENNTPPDPKKMTPTQKAAYAISFAQKGSAGATGFREKIQFVELMGQAKHWKQYKDKYISENLTQKQAEAMKKILQAYGNDQELITGTMYEGKYYPGEAPKGVAAAYNALKCKAMTERKTPINYHYQGGSDILGLLDPTKAAKSVQGMSQPMMDKMNQWLEPALKEMGTDKDGYPYGYKLTKTSSPGMVDMAEATMLEAVDKKNIPLKNARKYLQLKQNGSTYVDDMKQVIASLQNGGKVDMTTPFGKKMKKLMGSDAQKNLTALANLIKKYDTGKFDQYDSFGFEQNLAYKAKPQEQMAYLRLKAAVLSDKTTGSNSLNNMDENGKFTSPVDFSQYTGDEWSAWQGTGTDVPQNPTKNPPETPAQQPSEPSTTNTASQSPQEKSSKHKELQEQLGNNPSHFGLSKWLKYNMQKGDKIQIEHDGQIDEYTWEGSHFSLKGTWNSSLEVAEELLLRVNNGNGTFRLKESNFSKKYSSENSNKKIEQKSNTSVGQMHDISPQDITKPGTNGGMNNVYAETKLQGNTVITNPNNDSGSPVSTNQPSGYFIAQDRKISKALYTGTTKFKNWLAKIQGDIKHALDCYKNGAYDTINKCLGQGTPLSATYKGYVKNIDKAMNEAQLQQDSVMYRGARLDDMMSYFSKQMNIPVKDLNPVQLIGRTWHNEAYMSCSGSQQANWGSDRDLQLVLCVPKGKGRGCYVDGVNGLCNNHEDEYLINRGAKMMINDVRYESTQKGVTPRWHVYVTITDYEQKQM